MILFHNRFRLVLAVVVDDAHEVLTDLNLPFVRLKVHIDSVVVADGVSVKNLHPAR